MWSIGWKPGQLLQALHKAGVPGTAGRRLLTCSRMLPAGMLSMTAARRVSARLLLSGTPLNWMNPPVGVLHLATNTQTPAVEVEVFTRVYDA